MTDVTVGELLYELYWERQFPDTMEWCTMDFTGEIETSYEWSDDAGN